MDRGNFNSAYTYGKIAESLIAQWLMITFGYILLPAYEIETHSGKGPRLSGLNGDLIAPDLLAILIKRRKVLMQWCEIKHKDHFSWFRTNAGEVLNPATLRCRPFPGRWQTGIDLRHFEDYIKVQEQTGIEVFLLFLHSSSIPSLDDLKQGSEKVCPTGLFGGSLYDLMQNWDHKDSYENKKRRKFPMVYWNVNDLNHLATLDEFMAVLNSKGRKPTTEMLLGSSLDDYLKQVEELSKLSHAQRYLDGIVWDKEGDGA
jgi:hypothetical protein